MIPKFMHKRRLMRGASLTESTIVLGIVGILLGGIWAMANDMRNSVKQQKFAELLTSTVDGVRGIYAGKAFFDSTLVTNMMPNLARMNIFPGDVLKQVGLETVVVSPFGEVTPHPVPNAGATPHRSFYVCGWRSAPTAAQTHCDFIGGQGNVPLFAVEALVNRPNCIQAVMRNSNPVTQPGLVAVHINGGAALALPVPLVVPPATPLLGAVRACANAVNYIDFVYRLTP